VLSRGRLPARSPIGQTTFGSPEPWVHCPALLCGYEGNESLTRSTPSWQHALCQQQCPTASVPFGRRQRVSFFASCIAS